MWNTMILPSELRQLISSRDNLRLGLFRSRKEINVRHLRDASFVLCYPGVPTHHTLCIVSACLGSSADETDMHINMSDAMRVIDRDNMPQSITLDITYIYGHSDWWGTLREALDAAETLTKLEYTAALTITPYHKLELYYKESTNTYHLYTSVYQEEFMLKAIAVIAHHKGYEYPEGLLDALLSLDSAKFTQIIIADIQPKLAAERAEKLRQTLETIPDSVQNDRERNLRSSIASARDSIARFEQGIRETYTKIADYNAALLSLKDSSETIQELKELLLRRSEHELVSIHPRDTGSPNPYLELGLILPLKYWEEDELQAIKRSGRMSDYIDSSPAIKQLLDDILINRTVKLWIEQSVLFPLTPGRSVTSRSRYLTDCTTGIGNPHLVHYDCWGENSSAITRAVAEMDFLTAYSITISTVAQLNIIDTAVFSKFMQSIKSNAHTRAVPCLELENGECISIQEYERRYNNGTLNNNDTGN